MNADDPKFTAHVLGEDEDLTPAECAEIDALIANDPAAAAEAAETRAIAARLRAELPGEAAAALADGQRAAVFKAAATTSAMPAGKVVRFPRRMTVLAAIAACVIVGVSYGLLFRGFESQQASNSLVAVNEQDRPAVTVDAPAISDPQAAPSPNQLTLRPTAPVTTPAEIAQLATAPTPRRIVVNQGPVEGERLRALERERSAAMAEEATLAKQRVETMTASAAPEAPAAKPMAGKPAAPGGSATGVSWGWAVPAKKALTLTGGVAAFGDEGVQLSARGAPVDDAPFNTTAFDAIAENPFLTARDNPLSTLSVDVDTASYAIIRRFLNENRLPPKGAVRVEELLNYFTYDYPQPKGDVPFSATMEVAACPWEPEHRLVRVGLKGREIPNEKRPPSNLVFLIDVSGSMNMPNKLPLLQQCFSLLIEQLGPKDRVAIVTYAGKTGVALESTHDKEEMQATVDRLRAGGSTNGASGVQLAYKMAEKNFIKGGTNRVILATDGDWNVGITNQSELLDMIAKKAKSGVFLTVLGFGMDNLKD